VDNGVRMARIGDNTMGGTGMRTRFEMDVRVSMARIASS